MTSNIRSYWWESKKQGRSCAMLKWEVLCTPKGMGGLDFRDLKLFNLALFGGQVQHFVNNKDTLCYRVFCSKYFPKGNIFKPKHVDKPSYVWTSILATVKNLEEGFGWQIGDGQHARIREDQWGFERLSGVSLVNQDDAMNISRVGELWILEERVWDKDRVRAMYGET